MDDEVHELERPYYRPKGITKGYSGHLPTSRLTKSTTQISDMIQDTVPEPIESETQNKGLFRKLGQHMDTRERYETAKYELFRRGQTQEMLMRLVQAKLSERVTSYAQQHIWLKNLFNNFDGDGSDGLDEGEFRQCLELMNIQFGNKIVTYHKPCTIFHFS